METKSSVVKSRSSNSAKTVKSEHQNKKSRSNADFPPYGAMMKKRGVYVEPNRLRISELEKNQGQERPKAPRRPPPGNKKFLASVLTILSKSTTGTQYPDTEPARRRTEKKLKTAKRLTKPVDEEVDKDIMKNPANDIGVKENTTLKKKLKYRSKALNDEVDKEYKKKPFVVLKPQKEMVQTPSIYSENDSFNWSNLPSLVKKTQQQNVELEKKAIEMNNELAKEIMEGRRIRSDKRVRIDEPKTLVADLTLTKKTENVMEANGKLYNFFVDLLETTINVYNPKEDFSKTPYAPSEASSTKIPLEMNESVAKKLRVQSEKPEKSEATSLPSNPCYCLKDLEICNRVPNLEPTYEMPQPKRRRDPTQYATESFSFMRKPIPKKLTAASEIETKKKTPSRKQKKKTLLNLFKEQLKMDDSEFDEPQNLYQALRVMAQNKRRCQKTIHFEEKFRKREKRQDGFPDCMFKRRKVISPSTKESYKKPKRFAPSITGRIDDYKRSSEYSTDLEDQSYHSLEVYGYDYAASVNRGKSHHAQKDVVYTNQSTPSYTARSIYSNDLLEFSDTDSMYFY